MDNPDQRIEADITTLVTWTRQFVPVAAALATGGIIPAIVTMVTFTIMPGPVGPDGDLRFHLGHAMVYLLMMFVFLASVVAFWIGRPLIRLNFLRERLTANFRFALVRVRENAGEHRPVPGEEVEHRGLMDASTRSSRTTGTSSTGRCCSPAGTSRSVRRRWSRSSCSRRTAFFAGSVSFGQLNQTASAFGNLSDALSFFRLMYDDFTAFRASIIRLDGLRDADEKARHLPTIATADGVDVGPDDVQIRKPDGEIRRRSVPQCLVPGEALVVKGRSGSGTNAVHGGLSGLWPYLEGTFTRPPGTDIAVPPAGAVPAAGRPAPGADVPGAAVGLQREESCTRSSSTCRCRTWWSAPRRGRILGESPIPG